MYYIERQFYNIIITAPITDVLAGTPEENKILKLNQCSVE